MQRLVNGAGIDRVGEDTKVTIVCAADNEEGKGRIIKASGKSFFDAVRNTASESDKKLYWGHTGVIILGESVISDIDEILGSLLRARDVYHDIALVAARGATSESILESGNGDVSESICNMFSNEKNSKRFEALRIWELLREREEFGVYVLPTVSLREKTPWLSGGAVIGGGKLLGYLSGEEMLLRSVITEKSPGGYLPLLKSGDSSVSFELLSVNTSQKENRLDITVTLSPAEVRGHMSRKEMEAISENYFMTGVKELIKRAERENLGDILMLGKEKVLSDLEITCDVTISDLLGGEK